MLTEKDNKILDQIIQEKNAMRLQRFKDSKAHAEECYRQWAASDAETQRLLSRKYKAEEERDIALYYLLRIALGLTVYEVQQVSLLMMEKDKALHGNENSFVTTLEIAAASKIDIYRSQNGGSTFEYSESVDAQQPDSISIPGRDAQPAPPNLVEG